MPLLKFIFFGAAMTRANIAFWFLGLINNISYVIMIAGAKNISNGGIGLVVSCHAFLEA